jgi:hypothetical protein
VFTEISQFIVFCNFRLAQLERSLFWAVYVLVCLLFAVDQCACLGIHYAQCLLRIFQSLYNMCDETQCEEDRWRRWTVCFMEKLLDAEKHKQSHYNVMTRDAYGGGWRSKIRREEDIFAIPTIEMILFSRNWWNENIGLKRWHREVLFTSRGNVRCYRSCSFSCGTWRLRQTDNGNCKEIRQCI